MTFNEAKSICEVLGGGRLLEGLEFIRELLIAERDEEANIELSEEERMAYFICVNKIRPFFVNFRSISD